jgi:ribosome-associated toxin RatA of RatAB toxin-antitoxin module
MLASFRIRTPAICDLIFRSELDMFFSKWKMEWHFFRLRYHELIIKDCLDYQIKSKLQQKIYYHQMKLNTPREQG